MTPQANPAPNRVRFGPFEFQPASGELRKFGTRIRLQGQPLEILALLVTRAGEPVSREELQQRLWNGNTFVDFENGLNTAVNKLRQALGESADEPRYVETVPGRGYRFIGSVEKPPERAVLEIAPPPPASPAAVAAPAPTRWRTIAAATALAAAAAGVGYFAGTARSTPASARQPRLRFSISPPDGRVMHPPSSRQSFALSPDAAHLAFSAMNAGGGYDLFVRDLNSLESRPVPNSAGAYNLFWAPDSQSLLFVAAGKLRRFPIHGGGEGGQQILGDVPSFTFSGAITGVNRILLGGRRFSAFLDSASATLLPVKQDYNWPQLLPDGRHILDSTYDSNGRRRVRVTRLDDGATVRELMHVPSRVEFAPSPSRPGHGHLVYVQAGNLLAHPFDVSALRTIGDPVPIARDVYLFAPSGAADFSVSRNGLLAYQPLRLRSQLAWVDRQGRVLDTITGGNLGLRSARLSPDGRSVVTSIYDTEHGVVRLWVFDTATKAGRQMAVGDALEDSGVWSPDSRWLVYNRAHAKPNHLYLRDVSGVKTDEPLPEKFFQTATDWSADGRFVAYGTTGFGRASFEDNGDVYLIDMIATPVRKTFPLLTSKFHEANATWSPDGKWLAFTSNESGSPELYVQRFQGGEAPELRGERIPVTRNGAQAIRWRRDGKELYYLALDGRIHAVPVTPGEPLRFGEAKALFGISTAARAAIHCALGFDVSSDGQRFVVPVVTSPGDPAIVVVQNGEL